MLAIGNLVALSRAALVVLCLLRAEPTVAQAPETSYALEPGKMEVSVMTGFYRIDYGEYYSPGPSALLAGSFAVGLKPHVAVEIGVSRGGYRNDLYWKPEPPHNPYLATGAVLSFFGGGRYEFRRPSASARPYLGGGLVATRFTNVERGPKTLCFDDGNCLVMAPELFEGTKLSAFFDMGINFMVRPRWGVRVGMKPYVHKGDETVPVRNLSGPSGTNYFWYTQLYVGVLHRWR